MLDGRFEPMQRKDYMRHRAPCHAEADKAVATPKDEPGEATDNDSETDNDRATKYKD